MKPPETTKRSRIVNGQSKHGCFTCKFRKVKCDETRPSCLRCSRSSRECGGYRDSVASNVLTKSESRSVVKSLGSWPDVELRDSRHALLACSVLQHSEAGNYTSLWSATLPQLIQTQPLVTCTATALGAALELASSQQVYPGPQRTSALVRYERAIQQIQTAISRAGKPTEAILLACALLTCTELVLWREVNALTHIVGAMKMLSIRDEPASKTPHSTRNDCTYFKPQDEIDMLYVHVDIQAASYALGLPPRLPPVASPNTHTCRTWRFSDLELEVLRIIHSSYAARVMMLDYKYIPHDCVPHHLVFAQARYIAELQRLLTVLDDVVEGYSMASSPSLLLLRSALILRCQVNSCMIYLSTAINAHERGYDEYAVVFEQIIEDSKSVQGYLPDRTVNIPSVLLSLGLLQPLFFTAMKFRDPKLRRATITMLRKGGREGPWEGKLLAAVATRAVEVEESTVGGTPSSARDIVEKSRLHGVTVQVEEAGVLTKPYVRLGFSLCRDVNHMVTEEDGWEDLRNWIMWDETMVG